MIDPAKGGSGREHGRRNLPAIIDRVSNWYQGWYFDLRLEEEIVRSSRYHLSLSLLILFVTDSAGGNTNERLLKELLSDVACESCVGRTYLPF